MRKVGSLCAKRFCRADFSFVAEDVIYVDFSPLLVEAREREAGVGVGGGATIGALGSHRTHSFVWITTPPCGVHRRISDQLKGSSQIIYSVVCGIRCVVIVGKSSRYKYYALVLVYCTRLLELSGAFCDDVIERASVAGKTALRLEPGGIRRDQQALCHTTPSSPRYTRPLDAFRTESTGFPVFQENSAATYLVVPPHLVRERPAVMCSILRQVFPAWIELQQAQQQYTQSSELRRRKRAVSPR